MTMIHIKFLDKYHFEEIEVILARMGIKPKTILKKDEYNYKIEISKNQERFLIKNKYFEIL